MQIIFHENVEALEPLPAKPIGPTVSIGWSIRNGTFVSFVVGIAELLFVGNAIVVRHRDSSERLKAMVEQQSQNGLITTNIRGFFDTLVTWKKREDSGGGSANQ